MHQVVKKQSGSIERLEPFLPKVAIFRYPSIRQSAKAWNYPLVFTPVGSITRSRVLQQNRVGTLRAQTALARRGGWSAAAPVPCRQRIIPSIQEGNALDGQTAEGAAAVESD